MPFQSATSLICLLHRWIVMDWTCLVQEIPLGRRAQHSGSRRSRFPWECRSRGASCPPSLREEHLGDGRNRAIMTSHRDIYYPLSYSLFHEKHLCHISFFFLLNIIPNNRLVLHCKDFNIIIQINQTRDLKLYLTIARIKPQIKPDFGQKRPQCIILQVGPIE